jgi:hypothetical protein
MTESSLVFAIIIICCILVSFQFEQICNQHINLLMWDSCNSYIDLAENFGIPDTFDPAKGGGAIWNIGDQTIRLFDTPIDVSKNQKPEPTIQITTPLKLFAGINPQTVKISEQGRHKRISEIIGVLPQFISYDPIAQTLTTRFYNLQIALCMTMLCMKITTGELSQIDAKCMLADTLRDSISGKTDFLHRNDFDTYQNYVNEYQNICVF